MGLVLIQRQSNLICMTQIAESGFLQAIHQLDIGHQESPRDMLPIMLPYLSCPTTDPSKKRKRISSHEGQLYYSYGIILYMHINGYMYSLPLRDKCPMQRSCISPIFDQSILFCTRSRAGQRRRGGSKRRKQKQKK